MSPSNGHAFQDINYNTIKQNNKKNNNNKTMSCIKTTYQAKIRCKHIHD